MNELEKYIKSYFGVIQQNDLKIIGSLFQLTTLFKVIENTGYFIERI